VGNDALYVQKEQSIVFTFNLYAIKEIIWKKQVNPSKNSEKA